MLNALWRIVSGIIGFFFSFWKVTLMMAILLFILGVM